MNSTESTSTPTSYREGGFHELFNVALPLLITLGTASVMQFCDRVFLAQYSSDAIAAAAPTSMLYFSIVGIFGELVNYSNTFVSQYHGAGQPHNCAISAVQGVVLGLLSWPIVLAFIPIGHIIIRLAGHGEAIELLERQYFDITMVGCSLLGYMNGAIGGFFTGRGDTRTVMLVNLLGCIINIFLDYSMIFGKWGFPEMGMRGAAYATVISMVAAPAILAVIFLSPAYHEKFATRSSLHPNWPLIVRMLKFGMPSAIHTALDCWSFTFFLWLIGCLGQLELAASSIAMSINHLSFMPLLALHIATLIIVGKYQGAKKPECAMLGARQSLYIAFVYVCILGTCFVALPHVFIALFSSETTQISYEALFPITRKLLVLMAIWGLFDCGNLVFSGALKGAGDTTFAMLWASGLAWIFWIPGVIYLYRTQAGLLALWIWTCIYIVVLAFGFAWRWFSGRWKTIQVIKQ